MNELELVVRIAEKKTELMGNFAMIQSQMRLLVAIITVIACSTAVQAQGTGSLGTGSLGTGSLGIGSLGQSGSTGGSTTGGTGNSGMVGGLDANSAFDQVQRGSEVGLTGSTGKGFSESSVAPPGTGVGAVTPGGIGGGRGGFGGIGGFGNLLNNANAGGSEASKPVLRTRLRSAIQIQSPASMRVKSVAASRFQSLPSQYQLRGVNVQMQGRTAVIQGSVLNESDRRMSHLLMSLEPGVSRVENRVIVRP